jgi:hypothetical protein
LRHSVFADKLRAFDIIEAVCGDHWLEILVLDTEKGYPLTTKILRTEKLPTICKEMRGYGLPPGHDIIYSPESHTYQAIRLSDGVPLTPALPTREAARRELVDHATLRGNYGSR